NDTIDSDANTSTGQTDVFTIGTDDNFTIDAGLVPLPYGSIGDRVWHDLNGNGIQDTGEPGIADVEVQLFTASGDYFSATTTDSSGHYQFDDVAPGSYYAIFTQPADYSFAPTDQGGNDAVDSDADASGQTSVFSLAMSENKTDLDAGLVLTGGSVGD